jgi:capsular exopolysaccharide synthesis family protein
MENNRFEEEDSYNDFDLNAFLYKYVSHWKWFVVSLCIGFLGAFVYLRYSTPQYNATTTILVKDEKKGGMLSELSAFADMMPGGGMVNNVDNEVEVLKSRTLVESVVEQLNLNIQFFVKGNIVDKEIYTNAPIKVLYNRHNPLPKNGIDFNFEELTAAKFKMQVEAIDDTVKVFLAAKDSYNYGEQIATAYGNIVINKLPDSDLFLKEDSKALRILISPFDNVVANFREKLIVSSLSKTSSVVEVSITDGVIAKSEEFLDNMIQTYNADAAEDKNYIAENTSLFIENRLKLIIEELDGVEQDVQVFKKSNQLSDIESEAKLFLEGSNLYDQKVVETEIQLNIVTSMLDFIKKSTSEDLLPSNIISGEGDAGGLISSYNELVLNRNRLLKSATAANPSVEKIDQQIGSLKSTVKTSLMRMQTSLNIQKRDLNKEEDILNTKIAKIPLQERQFRVISRQQKVKEELYLYLLQKREETAISLAATEPNARVIDSAKANKIPVSPKNKIIYLAGILLGLLVPFGVIYTHDLLDTKIKTRLDLEGKTAIPFIGDVPTSDTPIEIIKSESRTSAAEALRIIRTNLEFMLNAVPDGIAKTIFTTSTFPKEGKTFISVNLAATFALTGKKVLLIGMDVRNPRLDEYLTMPDRGLTNYLSLNDLKIEDLIVKIEGFDSLYALPAGIIPPNPAELLMGKKVETLMDELKLQYDYLIVDTAPVILVADTLLIAKYADCFVYVVRANFLEKKMLTVINNLYTGGKLPNMCMLLNDTDSTKGYGYGYGYGHEVEKKRFWQTKKT